MAARPRALAWRSPPDRGAWPNTVGGVTEGQTRLSNHATAAARSTEMSEPILNANYPKGALFLAFNSQVLFKWIFRSVFRFMRVKVSALQLCPSLRPLDCSLQAPLSLGLSRREHWRGCAFLLQRVFPCVSPNLPISRTPLLFFSTKKKKKNKCAPVDNPTHCV